MRWAVAGFLILVGCGEAAVLPAPLCGNGLADIGEGCDDGNTVDGDGCTHACVREIRAVCGDGRSTDEETCDDGNDVDDDGCTRVCQVVSGWACPTDGAPCAPRPGDGVRVGDEACDDGNTSSGDGCAPDSTLEHGWTCDASAPSRCETTCGDGIQAGLEGCDDGNTDAEDSCSPLCVPQNFWRTLPERAALSAREGSSALWTGSRVFLFGGGAELTGVYGDGVVALGGGALFDPVTGAWFRVNPDGAPSPRRAHAAVWTGSRALIWGGFEHTYSRRGDGAIYDPERDEWTPIESEGAPSARETSAIWTGSEMIVWGGHGPLFDQAPGGGRYDPALRRWSDVSDLGAPSTRNRPAMVWTGSEMIVWGGFDDTEYLSDGALYDPAADTWRSMRSEGAPQPRAGASVVWSGSEMIVWGGEGAAVGNFGDGARYDPVLDRWLPLPMVGAPSPRNFHSAVWTGSEMVVFGGRPARGEETFDNGAVYIPAINAWAPLAAGPTPRARASATWTGTEVFVWGGQESALGPWLDDGGLYDVRTTTWRSLVAEAGVPPLTGPVGCTVDDDALVFGLDAGRAESVGARYSRLRNEWTPIAPPPTSFAPRLRQVMVWTGAEMILWGGTDGRGGSFNDGARYRPATDSWAVMSRLGGLEPREDALAVWTGTQMLIWAGNTFTPEYRHLTDGALYDPSRDVWRLISSVDAPSERGLASGVWTGSQFIVFGGIRAGSTYYNLNNGASYDPALDRWTPLPPSPLAPRSDHSAVWTGTEMVVSGGWDRGINLFLDDGAAYDPTARQWRRISGIGAPTGPQSAIWTGREMIAFSEAGTNLGGRYDPVRDRWRPTPASGAPSLRSSAVLIWLEDALFVWGGAGEYSNPLNSGALFSP